MKGCLRSKNVNLTGNETWEMTNVTNMKGLLSSFDSVTSTNFEGLLMDKDGEN